MIWNSTIVAQSCEKEVDKSANKNDNYRSNSVQTTITPTAYRNEFNISIKPTSCLVSSKGLFWVLMLLMVSQLESLVCFGDNSVVMLLVTVTVVVVIVCSCVSDVSFCHYLTTEYFWRFLLDRTEARNKT